MAGLTKTQAARISLGSKLRPSQAQQVAECARLLSQLLPLQVVYSKLREKFQVSQQRVLQIVKLTRKVWAEELETDQEQAKAQYINAYKLFYNQAMAKEAHGPARAALRDLSILEGINPEVNAQGRLADAVGEAASAIDPDRIRARIDELVSKRASAAKEKP